MQSAIVLGGGMIGVSAALHLRQRGWSVTLVDRREPGRETSYGNAGMIQAEAVRPYPMPRDLASLLKIATGRTNDVRYSLSSLHLHIEPLLRYWWHSAPKRHREAIDAWARLIAYATAEHDILIREAHADNLIRRAGYRHLHRDAASFDLADQGGGTRPARIRREVSRALGQPSSPRPNRSCATTCPARSTGSTPGPCPIPARWSRPMPSCSSASAAPSCSAMPRPCGRPRPAGRSTPTRDASTLRHAVVTLGPWSPNLLHKFGYRIPLVRKRGYHMHYSGGASLDLPLVDKAGGYAMGPMAKGIRITTGAELTGMDALATPVQLASAEALRARADRPRQARRARPVVRHPPLHARHAAGARASPASSRPLDEFRPRPPGLYARARDGPPARRDDERRDAGDRSDAIPA